MNILKRKVRGHCVLYTYDPFPLLFFSLKSKEVTCREETQGEQPTDIREHKEWVVGEVTETKHTTDVVGNTYRALFRERSKGGGTW